ncbi:MAG: DUF6265 family protein [Bacteroidota bacterium]|nr:DUF6265 family protein [Bacteroidota bacterium]
MKRLIGLALLLSLLASCGLEHKPEKAFLELNKLQGHWSSNNNIIFFENWELKDDSTLSGSGYSLRDKDTVFSEVLMLTLRNGKITYLAKDPGQNRAQAIPFLMKKARRDKFVFENLEHDYPQRIIYKFKEDTLLNIRLETAKGTKGTEFLLIKK